MKKLLYPLVLILFSAAQSAAQTPAPEGRSGASYRLEYALIQLDDGKRVNSRQFVIHVDEQTSGQARSIYRVPVRTKEAETVYIDVGLKIDATVMRQARADGFSLVSTIEMSSFVEDLPAGVAGTNPVFKTASARAATQLAEAKPVIIASIDEFDTTRRYEVQLRIVRLQ